MNLLKKIKRIILWILSIIKEKGGIGTYKNQTEFFTQQMVHFDCRGYRARWNK